MMIENPGFAAAALLSLATWGIHTFVGGPFAAKPLLASDMKTAPKLTNYYCWHLVTLTLLAMSGGFAHAATTEGAHDLGAFLTILAIAFCLWSVALFVWKRRHPIELPQWILFAAISAAALWGVFR